MAVTVDDIKTSLRLDLTEDDTLIQGYLDSAKEYVQTAVSTTAGLTQYKQYDFCGVVANAILVSKPGGGYEADSLPSG